MNNNNQQPRTLYVSDLDGTLINSQSVLSDYTIKTLNKLIHERNILFTVATARTPATVTTLLKDVDATLPFIVLAGGAVWDNHSHDYVSVRTLQPTILKQLLDIFNLHNIHPFVYRHHGQQIRVHHTPSMTDQERQFIMPRITTPYKTLITEEHISADDEDLAMLLFAIGPFTKLRALADDIDNLNIPCSYNCYHDIFDPSLGFLDLYTAHTNKARAIQDMAKSIHANRIVVFGDNLNDIPMMRIADWSVAVDNAFDEVKQQANKVIGHHDDDAVIKWIEKDSTIHIKKEKDEKEKNI